MFQISEICQAWDIERQQVGKCDQSWQCLTNFSRKECYSLRGLAQKRANLVDLEKCCKVSIWLLSELLIRPRTSPPKFRRNGGSTIAVSRTHGARSCGLWTWRAVRSSRTQPLRTSLSARSSGASTWHAVRIQAADD